MCAGPLLCSVAFMVLPDLVCDSPYSMRRVADQIESGNVYIPIEHGKARKRMKLKPLNRQPKLKRGLVYLWTGTGAGKTTAALGVALRSVGHGHKVVIIQWMKAWKNTGEFKIQKRLKPNYEVYMFGRYGRIKGWVSLKQPEEIDKKIAHEALEFAKQIVRKRKPHLLILDEINIACHIGLLDPTEGIAFLDTIPSRTTVYLTGRFAPKELIDRADFVTEVRQIKHPMVKGIQARRGIEYIF